MIRTRSRSSWPGTDITCADSAAIYSKNADKVFLTLAEGTENTLSNGGSYTAIDENNIDAVVFSKTDLTLNGSGSLTIDAQAGHGVVSKDELTVTGGSYTVTAAEHGMTGKDSLAVAAAHLPSPPVRTVSTLKTPMTPLWVFVCGGWRIYHCRPRRCRQRQRSFAGGRRNL